MRVSALAKRMIITICISLPVLVAASAVYYRSFSFLPFALGALLGAATNVLKIILLDRAVEKLVDMEEEKAKNYVRIQHFLRYILTGAVLVLAAVVPFISIWGAAAGILTYQVALFSMKRSAAREDKAN